MDYILHDSLKSGNAWKVRILLSQLNIPFRRVTHVLVDRTTYTPEFLALNPLGKVPVLITPDGAALFESNAILLHLSDGTSFSAQGMARTRIWQWMFFEQAQLSKPLAAARFWISVAKKPEQRSMEIPQWQAESRRNLAVVERLLLANDYLVDNRYTVADIALFPYVSMANESGIDLIEFPGITAWIARVSTRPGFVPLIEDNSHVN